MTVPDYSAGEDGCVMQWRRVPEPDLIDSGDEAQRSGEDSELEGDGGLHCCHGAATVRSDPPGNDEIGAGHAEAGAGASNAGGGELAAAEVGRGKAKMPWTTAMVPPSNMKVRWERGKVLNRP